MTTSHSSRALESVAPNALSIPKAREFAAFLGSNHSSGTRLIDCIHFDDGTLECITIDMDVSVPQRPVYAIKPTERIIVAFSSNEQVRPGVYSPRPDFPFAPHTNLQNDGEWRSLCLDDQPWYEANFTWNPVRLLDRIGWWLTETAHGSLHQPDQPLEPLLFGSYSDLVIPSEFLKSAPQFTHRWAQPERVTRQDGTYTLIFDQLSGEPIPGAPDQYAVAVVTTNPMTHGLVRHLPRTLGELDKLLAEGGVKARHHLRNIPGTWNRRFRPEQLELVLSAKLIVLVRLRKRRRDRGAVETVECRAFETQGNIEAVGTSLGVSWQSGVTGNSDSLSTQAQRLPEPKLALLNVREAFSPEIARRSNGLSEACCDQSLTAIGAGALGSPVLTNLTRSGYGRLTIIDDDVLHPHNLARHALGAEYIGWYKAEALASSLGSLMSNPSWAKPIVANILFPGNKSEELDGAYQDTDLILDLAASIPVPRHLVYGVNSESRRASLFLNPSGKALTLLSEDAGRNIPLDSLEMQFYRAIARDTNLESLLDHPDRNRTGQTCRDVSAEISQEDIAVHGGTGSRAIRQLAEHDGARIRTWLLDEEGNYQLVMDIEPAWPIKRSQGDWTVLLDSELVETLARLREMRLPNETGGVLVGSCDRSRKILYVVDALPSPSDSEELRTSYIRGTKGLKEQVRRIQQVTDGGLDYVGEWHSHPNGHGAEPSDRDRKLLDWIRAGMEEESETGVMCIIGEGKQLGVYL